MVVFQLVFDLESTRDLRSCTALNKNFHVSRSLNVEIVVAERKRSRCQKCSAGFRSLGLHHCDICFSSFSGRRPSLSSFLYVRTYCCRPRSRALVCRCHCAWITTTSQRWIYG